MLNNPDVEGPTLGSYTDGYNAIVEDEEYDLDRYQEDSEYRKVLMMPWKSWMNIIDSYLD